MIDLTPYMGHIYLTGVHWNPSNVPFIVIEETRYGSIRIKILTRSKYYCTATFTGVKECKKVTSIHDLIKQLLVGKNG